MQSFARAHAAGGDNWQFVAANGDFGRFAEAVGFDYFASAGGFAHTAQITVLDAQGRVYDQIYGSSFAPPAIVEPLKRLILGGARPAFSLAGLADRVKLLCTVYDPRTGKYYFNSAILVSIVIGVLCLGAVLHFLVREVRKSLAVG
jgi:protein SCO1/2